MVDAAHLPYRDNVEQTRAFTERAHAPVSGSRPNSARSAARKATRAGRTHPVPAPTPTKRRPSPTETGIDGLAVAVGSSHAMTTRDAQLDIELIANSVPAVAIPLVLHGSSGVPDDQLRQAVNAGIRKVNIGTALNVAFTGAIRDVIAADPRPPIRANISRRPPGRSATPWPSCVVSSARRGGSPGSR